jgi:hypothetical protein
MEKVQKRVGNAMVYSNSITDRTKRCIFVPDFHGSEIGASFLIK